VSLITGREWERAVWTYLHGAKVEGVACSRSPATAEHTGGRTRFTGAGPADYQVVTSGRRIALEVKAWTNGSRRYPLVRIEPSQAADMDAADLGVVLLRWAGSGPHGPDLVYLLPWATLGPLWWTAHRGEAARGAASLTEGDCRRLAVGGFGVDGVRLVMDEHGSYRCPAILPALVEGLA
jgi:hypothetical protein